MTARLTIHCDAALFSLSLHLLSGKFEPAVARAAAGSLFSQGKAFRF